MKRSCLGLTAILVLVACGGASAQPYSPSVSCPQPPPPPPQTWRPLDVGPKPVAPSCVTYSGKTRSCRVGDIDRYNLAIQAYNHRIERSNTAAQRYVAALNGWTDVVNQYAHCEINLVNAQAAHSD